MSHNDPRAHLASPRHHDSIVLFVRKEIPVPQVHSFVTYAGPRQCKMKLSSNGYAVVGICCRLDFSDFMEQLCRWACDGHCLTLGEFKAPHVNLTSGRCLPGSERLLGEFL